MKVSTHQYNNALKSEVANVVTEYYKEINTQLTLPRNDNFQ